MSATVKPAEVQPPDKEEVLKQLKQIVETEGNILQDVRQCLKVSLDGFVNKDISKLFKLAVVYSQCFKSLGITSKDDLENIIIRKNFRHNDIPEVVEELHDNEREWDDILKDVDKQFMKDGDYVVKEDEVGPVDVPLVNARTGESEEISNAKSRVLLISFGVQEGAQKWLEEMNCSYDMLLDKDRKVYQAFGLKRSVFKVWSISSMTYYAQQMAEGRDLPKPYENIHDDPIQMGGDFVMDKEGKMKLIYCSVTPRDRPSATMLLDIIKK